jgi:hypothetical protein
MHTQMSLVLPPISSRLEIAAAETRPGLSDCG